MARSRVCFSSEYICNGSACQWTRVGLQSMGQHHHNRPRPTNCTNKGTRVPMAAGGAHFYAHHVPVDFTLGLILTPVRAFPLRVTPDLLKCGGNTGFALRIPSIRLEFLRWPGGPPLHYSCLVALTEYRTPPFVIVRQLYLDCSADTLGGDHCLCVTGTALQTMFVC